MNNVQEIIDSRNAINTETHGLCRWSLLTHRSTHQSVANYGRDCPALRDRLAKMIQECGDVEIVQNNGLVVIEGSEKSRYASKLHPDGTVSIWDVYTQGWIRTIAPSDRILASLSREERGQVEAHLAKRD